MEIRIWMLLRPGTQECRKLHFHAECGTIMIIPLALKNTHF